MIATLTVPGLVNLRDVGGLAAGAGRRVRAGRLFRSATPYFLDAAGAALLVRTAGLGTRLDLRSRMEVGEATNEHLADLPAVHLPLRSGAPWAPAPHLTEVADRVAAHYVRYLEHSRPTVANVVRQLVGASGGVLVHCTAGKDRTGVVVAVLLRAVGVSRADVVADYARTADELEPLWAQLRSLPTYAERLAALPEEALTAEAATMERFLDWLEVDHGGAAAYLAECGVDATELAGLVESLTEEVR